MQVSNITRMNLFKPNEKLVVEAKLIRYRSDANVIDEVIDSISFQLPLLTGKLAVKYNVCKLKAGNPNTHSNKLIKKLR